MNWEWLLIAYAVAGWVIRIVMVPVILRRRFASGTALAWLGMIFLLPEVGLVLYLLIGVSHLSGRRARSYERIIDADHPEERRAAIRAAKARPQVEPDQVIMVRQAEAISGNPIVGGNRGEPISDSQQLIERLRADIAAATHHVHLLYYIFADDEIGRALADAVGAAAKRGVHCRLLVDASGSRRFLRSPTAQALRADGVDLRAALPVSLLRKKLARLDLRNHRKLAVIDGQVAYTGSHNIVNDDYGSRWAGRWVDLSARITGPIVAQIQSVFLDDWVFETGQDIAGREYFPPVDAAGEVTGHVVPTGPSHETQTFQRVLVAALGCAQRKIIMTTPYLVPDEPTMLSLAMAAARGVDVTIIIPKRSDHPLVGAAARAYIGPLIESGITIARYTPGLLHAKTITVDDSFALLGSANLDIRSFELNFEMSILAYGPQITSQIRFVQQSYLEAAENVSLQEWNARPWPAQLVEQAASLFSPFL